MSDKPYHNVEGYSDPTAGNAIQRITAEEYKRLSTAKKPPKYRNRPIDTPDGRFDSEGEYKRWCELKLLKAAGAITGLERQVKFPLQDRKYGADGKVVERAIYYVADFVYRENGEAVVEDFKSPLTRKNAAYVIKRKLMYEKYGLKIRETTHGEVHAVELKPEYFNQMTDYCAEIVYKNEMPSLYVKRGLTGRRGATL